MDVTSFLGGNFLTQLDLPQQPVVWQITGAQQQQVGTDTKICISFAEHQKLLGLNKTNLRTVASAYGTDASAWPGKALELYRDTTQFQGKTVPCIRVRIPQQQQAAAPVAAPQQSQPVAAPQQPAAEQPPWAGQ